MYKIKNSTQIIQIIYYKISLKKIKIKKKNTEKQIEKYLFSQTTSS